MGNPVRQVLARLLLAFVASAALVATFSAQSSVQFGYMTLAAASSKSAAADQAQARYGGKVLKVEEVSSGGGKAYRVKLLLEGGRIKIVTVDASNG